MYCTNCGNKLDNYSKFCKNCRKAVQPAVSAPSAQIGIESTQPPHWYTPPNLDCPPPTGHTHANPPRKKKNRSWLLAVIVIAIILLTLGVCWKIYKSYEAVIKSNLNAKEDTFDTGSSNDEAPTVRFDLSQYDEHGTLSCGLIWVERTTSAYDSAPETCFAYLDADGNVRSEWFSSEDWIPADFSGDMLVLRGTYNMNIRPPSEVYCRVYNTKFETIFGLSVSTNRTIGMNAYECEYVISDADSNGNIFAVGSIGDDAKSLYRISLDSIVRFEIPEHKLAFASLANLKRIEIDSGYYIVDFRDSMINYPSYTGIFYENGELLLEPDNATGYTVFSIDILSDNEIEIMFKGKDDKYYNVNIDFAGNFLTDPVAN